MPLLHARIYITFHVQKENSGCGHVRVSQVMKSPRYDTWNIFFRSFNKRHASNLEQKKVLLYGVAGFSDSRHWVRVIKRIINVQLKRCPHTFF